MAIVTGKGTNPINTYYIYIYGWSSMYYSVNIVLYRDSLLNKFFKQYAGEEPPRSPRSLSGQSASGSGPSKCFPAAPTASSKGPRNGKNGLRRSDQVIQFVTFLCPSWRSLNLWKGQKKHPKKVTKNCQVYIIYIYIIAVVWRCVL